MGWRQFPAGCNADISTAVFKPDTLLLETPIRAGIHGGAGTIGEPTGPDVLCRVKQGDKRLDVQKRRPIDHVYILYMKDNPFNPDEPHKR